MTRRRVYENYEPIEPAPDDPFEEPDYISAQKLAELGEIIYDRKDFAAQMARDLGLHVTAIYQVINRGGVGNGKGMIDKIQALIFAKIASLNAKSFALTSFEFDDGE